MSDAPLYPDDEGDKKKWKKRKSTRRKHKIHPEANGDVQSVDSLELRPGPALLTSGADTDVTGDGKKQSSKGFGGKIKSAVDVFRIGQKVQEGADKFKELKTKKWKPTSQTIKRGEQGVLGIERDPIPDPFKPNPHNEELISYFAQLASDTKEDTNVDLEFVEIILHRGANVNCTDKHGQTILHEACRAWEIDVAQFLIENGADVNKADLHGRSPMHVAAAVDYPEMLMLLSENGGNIECLTKGENQTPMHYAARNDACSALRVLQKAGANIHCRDYKGRTPLQVAAELDRSETAKFLLELGADASDKDDAGQPALVLMIVKMPAVAGEALNQLHLMDRANRKQYYDLHHLEPAKPDEKESNSRTALQVVVQYNQLDLIMHPVMQRLIDVKWEKFGKYGVAKQVVFALAYIIIWTVIALALEEPVVYNIPDDIWRMVLGVCAVALTVYQIALELQEFYDSKKKFEGWKKWRIGEIKRDYQYCHPRWPQESSFLQSEVEAIKDQSPEYFSDPWNYFDWFVYAQLMCIAIMHSVDIFVDAQGLSMITKRIFAVTIIFLWLRFMKTARAFRALGPFIVMLGNIAIDLARFAFLYVEFYIPYACAFWMIFGGTTVQGMATVDQLMFTLFRMTLVDEYDYEGMKDVDIVMAYILVTTFLMFSAILCLNLLIALLSDTFQRVYDNAKSNAVMQQASIILSIEDGLKDKKTRKFRRFIHTECAPDTQFYDDDQTTAEGDELQKVTFQIKDALDELSEHLTNDTALQDAVNTAATMQEDISELHNKQDKCTRQMKKMNQEMKEMKQLIENLISAHNTASSRKPSISKPSSNQVSPRHPEPTGYHHGTSDSSDDDGKHTPSKPRFARKRTSTPSGMQKGSQGYRVYSPRQPSLGLDSMLSQSFTLGPHKLPSVLLPSHEEPHIDESERLQQLRKEKQKEHRLRKEKEELFQQQQDGGGASHDRHSVNSVQVSVSQNKGGDSTTDC
ncbi:LOW QUALITY PROTEIN: uncharacterized protein [Amphiura filiformis]|uniref:LOW QUALITY PROTEIN: uncharacterized protein n=1 Tax=Amphiura filiformis TaxID=82378 RepID=UPI003B2243BA